jgi:hypothetical protein
MKIRNAKTKPTLAANFLGGAYTEIGASCRSFTIDFEKKLIGDGSSVNPRRKKSIDKNRANHSFLKIRTIDAMSIVISAFKRITFSFN